jgi:hypothetical protein
MDFGLTSSDSVIFGFFALLYNNLKVSGVNEDNLSTYKYIYSVEEVQS